MAISLEHLRVKLVQRIRTLDSGFERQLLEPIVERKVDKFALQEGYISALWQAWCSFCRELVMHSVWGATTKSGSLTASPHSALAEMEIAFVARQLANQQPINSIRALLGNHQEHTWGDVSKLNLVASGIGCSNTSAILTGLSSCLRIADLQLCRNASAHISTSTVQSVKASMVRYTDTKFHHPSDMAYWVDPNTHDFLWKSWIEEMDLASDFAVR